MTLEARVAEARLSFSGTKAEAALIDDLIAEVRRLNEWADGFSDRQLKERRLCELSERERLERIRKAVVKMQQYQTTTMLPPSREHYEALLALIPRDGGHG